MRGNEENLKPVRTKEEARERGRAGGIKSGEVRRKRKALRESMETLLNLPISNQRDFNKIVKMGIPIEDIDNSQLIVVALFNRAKVGDVMAIKELMKLIGEDTTTNDALEQLDKVLEKIEGNI